MGAGVAQAGDSPGGDSLTGYAERPGVVPIPIAMAIQAHSGSQGEHASGVFASFRLEGDRLPFSGKITCLRVQGNRAVAGGLVTKSESPFSPVGSAILIQVTDNGFPGAGRDTNINFGAAVDDLTTCPFNDFPEITITKGDFAVYDG